MKVISQRELRNDNASIMREVEQGESFTVTRNGVPVARLIPISEDHGLPIARRAKRPSGLVDIARVKITERSEDILDDLRGDR